MANDLILHASNAKYMDGVTHSMPVDTVHTLGSENDNTDAYTALTEGIGNTATYVDNVFTLHGESASGLTYRPAIGTSTSDATKMYHMKFIINVTSGTLRLRSYQKYEYVGASASTVSVLTNYTTGTHIIEFDSAYPNTTSFVYMDFDGNSQTTYDATVTFTAQEITLPTASYIQYLAYPSLEIKQLSSTVDYGYGLIPVSTTWLLTESFQYAISSTAPLSADDITYIDAHPNAMYDVQFNGLILPSGFSASDIDPANGCRFYDGTGGVGDKIVHDLTTLSDDSFYFKSTSSEQSYTFRSPIGTSLYLNGVEYSGNDGTNVIINSYDTNLKFDESVEGCLTTFYCYSNQLTGNIPDLSNNLSLINFHCYSNQLTGNIPDLSSNTSLANFHCSSNQLTGNIPDLSSNTSLTIFYCSSNQLTGNIPDLSNNLSLIHFYCPSNQLTGNIPDLSSNTSLTIFYCSSNQLTGYDGGIINCSNLFYADSNALSQSAVDAILLGFVNGSSTTTAIKLEGGTNAAPSITGEGYIDTLRARGMVITVTGGY